MTNRSERNAFAIPTRLELEPSDELHEYYLRFLSPSAQKAFRTHGHHIPIFSTQQVRLQTQGGPYQVPAHVVAENTYRKSVESMYQHAFRLLTGVKIERQSGKGLGIVVNLAMNQVPERTKVLEPPLFPEGTKGPVEVFSFLPEAYLGDPSDVNLAVAALRKLIGVRNYPEEEVLSLPANFAHHIQLNHIKPKIPRSTPAPIPMKPPSLAVENIITYLDEEIELNHKEA
jgi:hypothetical protein